MVLRVPLDVVSVKISDKPVDEFEDELYENDDLTEVSTHTNNKITPKNPVASKPLVLSGELELRGWRYLGMAQMGVAQQAFFHTGQTRLMLIKDEQALGEWRLTNIQKDSATFMHSKGKSLILKSAKKSEPSHH